jgi:hypothetical protein
MRKLRVLSSLFCLWLFSAVSADARAESKAPFLGGRSEGDTPVVPAPRGALEVGVNAAYVQPFGEIWQGQSVSSMISAGGAVSVDLGYRVHPNLGIGAHVLFHESTADAAIGVGNDFRGGTAGLQATYHFIPYGLVDPWMSLGTGYRLLWSNLRGVDNNHFTQGIQIARVLAGIDFRTSQDAAVGPFLGADANVMIFDEVDDEASPSFEPALNTFITVGVMGRFDIGGEREAPGLTVAKRQASAR